MRMGGEADLRWPSEISRGQRARAVHDHTGHYRKALYMGTAGVGGRFSSARRCLGGTLTHGSGPPRHKEGWVAKQADYPRGEKAAGTKILFSCRIGRTPACGGHLPAWRDSFRTCARRLRSL